MTIGDEGVQDRFGLECCNCHALHRFPRNSVFVLFGLHDSQVFSMLRKQLQTDSGLIFARPALLHLRSWYDGKYSACNSMVLYLT